MWSKVISSHNTARRYATHSQLKDPPWQEITLGHGSLCQSLGYVALTIGELEMELG